LNIVPEASIDYSTFNALKDRTKMTGEWLAYCSACPVPEIANVFQRANIPFYQITGVLENDPECWQEVDAWVEAARVAAGMANNRLGLMGHYYSGMLDIYSDVTLQCTTFGTHVEILEVDELTALRHKVTPAEVEVRLGEFHDLFDIQPGCPAEDLAEAARTAVALDRLVANHHLGSIAYYYKGTGVAENETTLASIIMGSSQLTARGVTVAGEYEVKNVQAMKIMDLFGAGGSFTEYYAIDLKDDVVLMGHDGPGHIAIAEGKT
jgi:L-arabinose isomerase